MKKTVFGIVLSLGFASTSFATSWSGYFFKACDDSQSAVNNPPPYMTELAHDTGKATEQSSLCAYRFANNRPENDWTVALVPFKTLQYFDDNQSQYQVIAQISDSVSGSNEGYSSYLIVKKDSDVFSLADLSNSTILTGIKSSFSTFIYPQYVLGEFFKINNINLINSTTHKKEVADFESNKAKAAFVNNYILSPEELKQYRVIMEFNWLPDYLVVVNNKVVSKQQASDIKQQLLNQTGRSSFSYHEPDQKLIDAFQVVADSK